MTKIATGAYLYSVYPNSSFTDSDKKCPSTSDIRETEDYSISGDYSDTQLVKESDISSRYYKYSISRSGVASYGTIYAIPDDGSSQFTISPYGTQINVYLNKTLGFNLKFTKGTSDSGNYKATISSSSGISISGTGYITTSGAGAIHITPTSTGYISFLISEL